VEKLVEVKNLKKWFWAGSAFGGRKQAVRAVDDVSFSIARREILGLVGESGCGKTTCGKVILRIHEPTSGKIFYDSEDITHIKRRDLIRLKEKMMIQE
jgi:peptide/nickel transport system ATP-binding protein/oligopeptide transport system ATP-binding protein